MQSPSEFWFRQLHHFSLQVAQCTSHIEYLTECVRMGVIPKGLEIGLPIPAFSPPLRNDILIFGTVASAELTRLTLCLYEGLKQRYLKDQIFPLLNILSYFPANKQRIRAIIRGSENYLRKRRRHNQKKLSSLFTTYLRSGVALPTIISCEWPPVFSSPSQIGPADVPRDLPPSPVPLMSLTINPPHHLFLRSPPVSPGSEVFASEAGTSAPASAPATDLLASQPLDVPPGLPIPANDVNALVPETCDDVQNVSRRDPDASGEVPVDSTAGAHQAPIVLNLSSKTLSNSEKSVLSKGFSFCPTPRVDHIRLHEDIQAFCESLRWRWFWHTEGGSGRDNPIDACLMQFKGSTTHEAPKLPPTHPVEQYIRQVLIRTSDMNFLGSFKPPSNLPRGEQLALKNLRSNPDIKIMPADKGSTIVLMDQTDYLREVRRQLEDRNSYIPLQGDPTERHCKEIRAFLRAHSRREGISKENLELMVPDEPRCPTLYILPKIHKPYSLPDVLPPGRPIVSSFGAPTERISAYVDEHLKPLVQALPSYCKDSFHFLEILRNLQLPSSGEHPVLMAVIDVVSLYTNIPHDEGLAALRWSLNGRVDGAEPSSDFLTGLAELVLTKNAFSFEGLHYLQIKGTAMGTRMAPSYANIFMGRLEQEFLSREPLQPFLWVRYIDDVFCIWLHGPDQFCAFMERLQSAGPVGFTHAVSTSTVTYLDVDVSLVDGQFQTAVHVKPTNPQQYLHWDSCHPPHVKRSIPRSLSIRSHRLCSEPPKLESHLSNLKSKLADRGYPHHVIEKRVVPASVRHTPPTQARDPARVFLTTEFFPGAHRVGKVLRQLHPLLLTSQETRDVFPAPPSVTYRRPQNIGNLLSHREKPPPPPSVGLRRCGRTGRCKVCNLVVEDGNFSSANNPNIYRVRGTAQCQTPNVVYELLCRECEAYYVGKTTTPLNLRINNHRASVKPHATLEVGKHANHHNLPFDDCYNLRILKALPPNTPNPRLEQSERAHIWVLGANRGPGLNIRD